MAKVKDLTGQRFGRIVVTEFAGTDKHRMSRWHCVCECGEMVTALGGNLSRGRTKSCGCLKKEVTSTANKTHGLTGQRPYRIWEGMKRRCTSKSSVNYGRYGGRGISYTPEWESFENFWSDMQTGYSDDLTLDRVDNNKGYSKENCRWATLSQQQRNRRKRKSSKTPFIGVELLTSGRFRASFRFRGKHTGLGTFSVAIDAATAYDNKCEELGCGRPNGTMKTIGE